MVETEAAGVVQRDAAVRVRQQEQAAFPGYEGVPDILDHPRLPFGEHAPGDGLRPLARSLGFDHQRRLSETAAAVGSGDSRRLGYRCLFRSGNPQPVDDGAAVSELATCPLRLQLLVQAIDEPVNEQPATCHRQAYPVRLAGAAGAQLLQKLLLLEEGT